VRADERRFAYRHRFREVAVFAVVRERGQDARLGDVKRETVDNTEIERFAFDLPERRSLRFHFFVLGFLFFSSFFFFFSFFPFFLFRGLFYFFIFLFSRARFLFARLWFFFFLP
jgi:hypothetical protein